MQLWDESVNAQAAGASGVVIFNEGQTGRTDAIGISLVDAAGNPVIVTIPVASVSFAVGANLYNQTLPILHFDYS